MTERCYFSSGVHVIKNVIHFTIIYIFSYFLNLTCNQIDRGKHLAMFLITYSDETESPYDHLCEARGCLHH